MKNMQASVRVLSQDEIELIHQESTAILDSVGMQLPNSEALALLKKQGCRIDGEIARFPREVVERALANRRAGDEPSERNTLGELTGSVSTEVYLIDLARRTRRPGTLDDIRKGIALTERLSHFPAPDAIVLPSDVPTQYADLMAFYTMFVYARKPGGTYLVNEAMAEPILDMAFAMNRKRVDIPLVLHGASGVPEDQVLACIARGICKVNYATELRIAFSQGVVNALWKNPDVIDPKKYLSAGRDRVFARAGELMSLCGCEGMA